MEEARQDLANKWNQFNLELRDIEIEFNHFYWIRVLFFATVKYLLHVTRLDKVSSWLVSKRGHVLHFLPLFVVFIVSFIVMAYCFILHQEVIVQQWCGGTSHDASSSSVGGRSGNCGTSGFILGLVCYIGFMIVCNFLMTTFSSPGIANISSNYCKSSSSECLFADCNNNHGNHNGTAADDDASSIGMRWRSYDGQGGCCYVSLQPCMNKERSLLQRYNNTIQVDAKEQHRIIQSSCPPFVCIPNPSSSFCKKCNIMRPPRCHHCSKCNRCVLQMDHHCYWINNCIGYNNYRSFVLTLVYLVLGCWLGVALLFFPFYATIQDQIQTYGFQFMYKHGSGFLDLPMPMDLWLELTSTGRLDTDIVLKMVFVILFFAGLPLSTFLYSHIRCMAQGLTTIEQMAKIEFQTYQLLRKRHYDSDLTAQNQQQRGQLEVEVEAELQVINPFHQGCWNNFMQIIGPNPWLCLLPISVQPLAPNSVSCSILGMGSNCSVPYDTTRMKKMK